VISLLFNSFTYLIFFAAVVALYYILPHKLRWGMLLAASVVFYMAWMPPMVLLILGEAFLGWLAALLIARTDNPRLKKIVLVCVLIALFGILFFFKYLAFLSGSLAALFGLVGWNYPVSDFSVILPMGISFHTFQNAGYTIDVYRGEGKPERNVLKYALFVMFFPQLVAGPIERAERLLPSLFERKHFSAENISAGVKQMLIGYFKKTVVADRLAVLVNTVYNAPEYHRGLQSVVATVFFAFQIYCDFSGYTDIAIGSAKCLGIDLMQNFRQPYLSGSVREFWKRWHISLSTWFRDYLYISLGGNRCSKTRRAFNVMVTFTVSGLWHGANWTFIIWGALHGIFQNIETWLDGRLKVWKSKPVKFLRYPLTFIAVCAAWIFFRANTIGDAFGIIGGLFSDAAQWPHRQFLYETLSGMGVTVLDAVIDCGLILLTFGMDFIGGGKSVYANVQRFPAVARGAFYFIIVALIFSLGAFGNGGQFIYFQF